MKSSFTVRYHHDNVDRSVKINIIVKQNNNVLYEKVQDLRCYASPLDINFEFETLTPIQLEFATNDVSMDLNPLYIDRIQLDQYADIPFFAHSGMFVKDNVQHSNGNCLYSNGSLIYTFDLPFCRNYNVVI